jgi:hypothetical protein
MNANWGGRVMAAETKALGGSKAGAGWSEGRRVRIAHPPRDLDFNDVLLGRQPCVTE